MNFHLPIYNALISDYAGELAVVAVPSNLFNLQEPGSNAEIPFCYRYVRPGGDFIYTFDLAAKVDVNGANEDPLYTHLKASCPPPKENLGDPGSFYFSPIKTTDITWNFEKFLIDTTGVVVTRYEPGVHPDDLRPDIDAVLAAAKLKKAKAQAKKVENKTYKRPRHTRA